MHLTPFPMTDLERAAFACWDQICQRMSQNPAEWSLTTIAKRNEPHVARGVFLLEHADGRKLVLKHVAHPLDAAKFKARSDLIAQVTSNSTWQGAFQAPQLHRIDADLQCILMDHVPGETLATLVQRHRYDLPQQDKLLRRAGAWLAEFHRQHRDEHRLFRPKFTLRYFRNIRAELKANTRKIAAKSLFLRGVAKLEQLAPKSRGRETVSCLQHGDLHCANLIISHNAVHGIDFAKDTAAPVGHDISSLLIDCARRIVNPADIPLGQAVPPRMLSAFFQGYDFVRADDPSVQLLLHAQILSMLQIIPPQHVHRTTAHHRMLAQLKPMAIRAFETA